MRYPCLRNQQHLCRRSDLSSKRRPNSNPCTEAVGAAPSVVIISEVLAGVPGGNSREFIELYNPRPEAFDLEGWSLWYLTRDGQDESVVYRWDERADIPGLGHYLLVREGEEFDLLPDAVYDLALFEGKGGLSLRDANGNEADSLGWGEAPAGYYAGAPLAKFDKGNSLERLPGGKLGNGANTGNNASDFVARLKPEPQNSGSELTPLPDDRLAISLEYPQSISPGSEFELGVRVDNLSAGPASGVLVSLPLAEHFKVIEVPEGAELDDGRLTWNIEGIEAGGMHRETLVLSAPFANVESFISGFYASSETTISAYGVPQIIKMDNSAIPIARARSLPEGSAVTIEGIVTMYPGGFFAGSSSVKFYVEDETGGVQVYADGGRFDVAVDLGDRVRVSGKTELFRDSLEIIPEDNLTDIVVLDRSGPIPEATEITILDNETQDAVIGRLNVVEGTAAAIDELAFHYEVVLEDEAGNRTLLYIEKDTGFNADRLNAGSRYRATGISELASGVRQLKPRLQSDVVEVFPPALLLDASAPTNVMPGEALEVFITAVNHTNEPLSNVIVTTRLADGSNTQWLIFELDANGGSETVSVSVPVPPDATGFAEVGPISAVADQWTEPVFARPNVTYVGEGVPIWAIQGDGARSPLIGRQVTTGGIVTGVFPDMDGFFMQSLDADGDRATSDGIFVTSSSFSPKVKIGDKVKVNGRVREDSGQTIVRSAVPADVIVRENEGPVVIEPIAYDPPADFVEANVYKESLEGMLVAIEQPATVVGPTNNYGETIVVSDKWETDLVHRSDGPVGYLIWVDDGTFRSHDDQSTLPMAAARGDRLLAAAGPLAYTFGNYKIAPVEIPTVARVEHELPSLPEASDNQFSIATFNVENMFDSENPHPDSPPRPLPDAYQHDLRKMASAIMSMGVPTIVAVQEIENLGVLEDLVSQPELVEYNYMPASLESKDSRGIDQGYLVRGDIVTVDDLSLRDAPGELFSRPPLVLKATIHLDAGDQKVVLLNNHFLSLSAGEAQTEPVRDNQAAWNGLLVEELSASSPDAAVIVLGDLNSFYYSKPINTLQEIGLRHAYEFFENEDDLPYTYIFEGAAQTIDHILMSENLFDNLTAVQALHIDADFPVPDVEDDSAQRVSDHDPLWTLYTVGK